MKKFIVKSLFSISGLKKFVRRRIFFCLAVFFVLFFLVSIGIIYVFEHQQNSDFTIFDAFQTVMILSLGEYGSEPHTFVGKVLSVVLLTLGIAVVSAAIGKLAALFIELQREGTMPKAMDGHIIICNWHDRGDRIVKELHSPLAAPDTDIIVITEQAVNEQELRISPEYERVFFIRNDPTLHDVLKRARAHLAASVILLADEAVIDPDAKTALIALAISKLSKESPKKPHIVAEVMNHRKIVHLLDAGIDEWVCSADYGLGILAQSALYGKLSEVYQQLLTYSRDTNEIYMVDSTHYPQSFFGKRFAELAELLNTHRDAQNPIILLGVKRAERVLLNPQEGQFDVLQQSDILIVVAFDPPDLRYLENIS